MMQSETLLGRDVWGVTRGSFPPPTDDRNARGRFFALTKGPLVALCHHIVLLLARECLASGTRLAAPAVDIAFFVLAPLHHMQQDSSSIHCKYVSAVVYAGEQSFDKVASAVLSDNFTGHLPQVVWQAIFSCDYVMVAFP